MIAETKTKNETPVWKKFVQNHWKMIAVFIIGVIVFAVGAIYVYLWFVSEAQLMGLVPSTLDLWTMGHIINFLLHLIFWEFIFIGIPLIIVAVIVIFGWWKKIPSEERQEYRKAHVPFGSRSKRSDSSGGFSFLIFIVFIIKIYYDGNWDVAIASWTFDYLVYSCLWALIWVAIIFGIPITIGGLWWLNHQMKKTP